MGLWAKIKVSAGLPSFRGAPGENAFACCPQLPEAARYGLAQGPASLWCHICVWDSASPPFLLYVPS